jgi:16S rRNA (cytosine967-C5)-methyltransferase
LITGDASTPEEWWDGEHFDRILLDVPCSATGVIRRHPDIKLLRRATDITHLSAEQSNMLAQLWPLLKPGGRLLYASCSMLKAENAEVITAFLAQHPEAADNTTIIAEKFGLKTIEPELPGLVIQVGEQAMDGFYYACLDKRQE